LTVYLPTVENLRQLWTRFDLYACLSVIYLVSILFALGLVLHRWTRRGRTNTASGCQTIANPTVKPNMPPVRGPMNTKGLKTERTHEENQERAYIAASRRCDRSLEARIESARRASEIHKRRTGRALRVTEQDVINEEMYEEEDDDLQSQYRRLQAHLGSSADLFNGRLNAWVLSQYGTRQMAMAAQNGMPFNPGMSMPPPNTPFFAYQPQPQSPTTLSPGMTQRHQSYRQSPYPQQYQRTADQRSQSFSIPQDSAHQQGMPENDMTLLQAQRRHSMAEGQSLPGTPQPQVDGSRPSLSRNASAAGMQPGHLGHPSYFNDQQFNNAMSPHFNFGGFPTGTSPYDPMLNQSSMSPLTTQMPPESQQIIGTSFEPAGQFQPNFMNMSHGQPVPAGIGYTYRPNGGSSNLKPGSEGMNQTLSPNPMTTAPIKIETNFDSADTPALTNNSASSPEQLNPQFSATALDFNGGLGMQFGDNKTPGELTTINTPDESFFESWLAAPSQ